MTSRNDGEAARKGNVADPGDGCGGCGYPGCPACDAPRCDCYDSSALCECGDGRLPWLRYREACACGFAASEDESLSGDCQTDPELIAFVAHVRSCAAWLART